MKTPDVALSARYTRQVALPEFGREGQEKLLSASVLVIGAGGLGSPAALYLAAAGMGRITIADGDKLEASNLQRQVLHSTPAIGESKALSAQRRLRELNPDVDVVPLCERLTPETARQVIRTHDFVLDCTDNFASKFMIADACHAERKPYSHAGIDRFRGQTMTVLPGTTACYRCIFLGPPADDGRPPVGPLGFVPGIIGTVQAAEAIRFVTGVGKLLTDRLLVLDASTMAFRSIPLRKNPECSLCGAGAGKEAGERQ